MMSFCIFGKVYGQFESLNNQMNFKIVNPVDSLQIDSLSILPNSFYIDEVDSNDYYFRWSDATLFWKNRPASDSVTIHYQRLPFALSTRVFHKDIKRLDRQIAIQPFYYDAIEAAKESKTIIDFGNVDYSGTFGRALSFGNNQDVVLNSQFNLQLEGDLGDSIRLIGAITDNTIPFQPEGNTQQIQEFDRVFLQLQRKRTVLTAGDHDIKRPESYFMNFYKRVQGAMVSGQLLDKKWGQIRSTFSASLAKGKFVRNVLTPLEGNQGPYKLTGPNGEQFFIVLAGTERVYIDGIQMKRGEDQDYIIDYNTAEVVFMPRRIITKDLRLVVEFEFADRNFLNSLFYSSTDIQIREKLKLGIHIYSNQDAKNQNLQQSLDSSQKQFLANIGDSIQQALYPSARFQDTFSNNLILYRKTDSLVNGTTFPAVYVFSVDPDSAKWQLAFSFVGPGNGHYVQSISNANGRVYAWKAPINGVKQGDYEPISVLVTPKKQQMMSAVLQYQIDTNNHLGLEGTLSQFDPNTFSKIHNQYHTGFAGRIRYNHKKVWSAKRKIDFASQVLYEFVQDRFKPLERFRNVEFARDWNSGLQAPPANEHLAQLSATVRKSDLLQVDYKFSTFIREKQFQGYQQFLSASGNSHQFRYLIKSDYTTHVSEQTKGSFLRPWIELEKLFPKMADLLIGTRFFVEHNPLRDKQSDTLLNSSFSFDALSLYIKNNPSGEKHFSAEYTLRHDRATKDNLFRQSTLGHTYSLNGHFRFLKNQELRITSAYRQLIITDSSITNLKPDESLLGRLEYQGNILNGFLTTNILYEMGSGQEPKREFTYVEVPAGQGLYVWRDYNNDQLKQLNEFEIALFPDEKRYIKVFTPTNQYVKAKYALYNQSISIQPAQLWKSTKLKGIRKAISMLYLQSALQLNNRFIGEKGLRQYNPFLNRFEDSVLINNASNWVNSILINRFSNKWGLDYIYTLASGKTLLNYGIDARQNKDHQLRSRYNPHRSVTLSMNYRSGLRIFRTQFLETRNYEILNEAYEPGISLLLNRNQLRTGFNYKYEQRQNKPQFGNEKAYLHHLSGEMRYNILSSGSISLKMTYASIRFNGNSNSAIGYTMLDGLLNGRNWLWSAGLDKRVSKNIEMSLEYEGRRPAGSNVIHTGRASLRAIF